MQGKKAPMRIPAALLALTIAASPAAAEVAPPAGLPGNTVTCAYDYMGPEDREIALLLVAREIIDGGKFGKTSANVVSVERLIAEAREKCLDRFSWSIGRSEAADSYAMTAILGEALVQAIETFKLPVTPLAEFYRQNRLLLNTRSTLGLTDRLKLRGFLKEHGWADAREVDFALGGFYIETLMSGAKAGQFFNLAGGTGRQLTPRRSSPAKTKARGKP